MLSREKRERGKEALDDSGPGQLFQALMAGAALIGSQVTGKRTATRGRLSCRELVASTKDKRGGEEAGDDWEEQGEREGRVVVYAGVHDFYCFYSGIVLVLRIIISWADRR